MVRKRLESFYAAYARGDLERVLADMDPEIDYISYAPVEVFPYLGHHRGKDDLRLAMQQAHAEFEYLSYKPMLIVTENGDAAAMIMAQLRQRATGRIIALFVADFVRMQNGLIVEIRQFFDSFDAVQQVIGKELELGSR